MAIQVRVLQHGKQLGNKWYGKAVKMGEVDMRQLAARISEKCTVTEADVLAVMSAMVHEMKLAMQDGDTVKLDGFGRFHLTVQSEMVDRKEDYNVQRHVKRVVCRFTPEAHREQMTRQLVRTFCSDAKTIRYTADNK